MGVGPSFHKIFIIHLGKIVLDENNVEFDFSIGHALVLFPFF